MNAKPVNQFTAEKLKALADDLKSDRIPLERITVTDNMQPGLRALIRKSGVIAFHVHYDVSGRRPFLKIGEFPDMSIPEAREITKTIRHFADRDIDVQVGLHERLIRELKDKGTKWKP